MSAPGNSPAGTPSRRSLNSAHSTPNHASLGFGLELAPYGSPGQPPRPPVVERTPVIPLRNPRNPNIERGRMPPPRTMAIHGSNGSNGPRRELVPSLQRVLLRDLGDEGPAVMPLGPGAAAPRLVNVNGTPPRAGLAQALGAPRRPPPQSRLAPPPPFIFPSSPNSPPNSVRTPNRSRRGRKQSRKQKRMRYTRRRR